MTLTVPEHVVREAGSIAMQHFKNLKKLAINKKSSRDLVTEADVAVEAYLKDALAREFPQFGFWGEESGQSDNQNSRWVVDPIDGTHSFTKGQYFWSVSVALEIDGDIVAGAVYVPTVDDYYSAAKGQGAWKNGERIEVSDEADLGNAMVGTGFACLRSYLEENNLERFGRIAQNTSGQRRFGSAAADICMVADGQIDAYWEQELNLYDVAAGALIAKEAGATVTDFKGNNGIFPQHILVTNGKLLEQILPLM
ncbi:MAG: inositol monophosphatase family protein [Gammaproteobacteria bacterium]